MKKINAKFIFTEKYDCTQSFTRKEVSVILEVDYQSMTFSVSPEISTAFVFSGNSKKFAMWLAENKAIEEAIHFGASEVGYYPKEENAHN